MKILQNFTIVKCYVFLVFFFLFLYEFLKGFSRKFIVPGSRLVKIKSGRKKGHIKHLMVFWSLEFLFVVGRMVGRI